MTPEQETALQVARDLAGLGVPLFVAAPDASSSTGFALPPRWADLARPDPTVVDAWQPGWALGMVTGVVLDVVDVDTYAGGQEPQELPLVIAKASTPSGGTHYLVPPVGVASLNGAFPGVDLKSGCPDGSGRGFAFLAPTERPSKVDGQVRPYRWYVVDDLDDLRTSLADPDGRNTVAALRAHVQAHRSARQTIGGSPRVLAASAARREWDQAVARLARDVADWYRSGRWGGQAHAALLTHTTHLARLSPDHAESAFLACFAAAGCVPDAGDLQKLESALRDVVPDQVVPDGGLAGAARFWAGGEFEPPPKADPPSEGPAHAARGGFAFLSEEEVEALPEPDRLVDGLLWQDSVARLFGPSGTGKTWVAIDLAAHVANGLPWMGHAVKQGPVLYVAAEGAPSMGPRFRRWRDAHQGRRTGVVTWPEAVAIGGENWGAFVEAVADLGPVLVLLDTQNAMTAGRRENSNDDAGDVVRALNLLCRASGCCALLVHHTGHDEGDRARGASALFAGLDTELQLGERRGGLTLLSRKQRYGRRQVPVLMDVAQDDHGWTVGPTGPGAGHFGDPVDDRARELLQVLQQDVRSDPSQSVRTLQERLRGLGYGVDKSSRNSPGNVAVRLYQQGAGLPSRTVAEEDSEDR